MKSEISIHCDVVVRLRRTEEYHLTFKHKFFCGLQFRSFEQMQREIEGKTLDQLEELTWQQASEKAQWQAYETAMSETYDQLVWESANADLSDSGFNMPNSNSYKIPISTNYTRQVTFGGNEKSMKGHLSKHAPKLGITKSAQEMQKKENQDYMKQKVKDFIAEATEVRNGQWDKTTPNALFYKNGNTVVVTDANSGRFITVTDGASGSAKFNQAVKVTLSK